MIGQVLAILSGVIGILSFAGAVLNGKRKDGYNAILRDSNKELRASLVDKDNTISQLEGKLKMSEVAKSESDRLRQAAVDMAQSRPAFEQLGAQMIEQHKELLTALGEQSASNSRDMLKLTSEISNLAKTIAKKEQRT